MITFYVDESGCLSNKGSKYLIIALISTTDSVKLRRTVHKLVVKLNKQRRKKSKLKELKFNKLYYHERQIVLKALKKEKFEIYLIVLKKSTRKYLSGAALVYRYLCNFAMDRAIHFSKNRSLKIVIDKFLNQQQIKRFDKFLKKQTANTFKFPLKIEIKHEDSEKEKCIQVADIIAGAVFQKYERSNDEYYNIIKEKIKTENQFFKSEKDNEQSHV